MACYFQLPLLGRATSEVESLNSYLYRLADAHAVSTHQLVRHIEASHLATAVDAKSLPKYLLYAQSQQINGWSADVGTLVTALETATGTFGLRSSTLVALHDVMAFCGARYLKSARAWCPVCLSNDIASGVTYERLIWIVRGIDRCPVHRVQLQTYCPNCRKPQTRIRSGVGINDCYFCESSLIPSRGQWIRSDNPGCERNLVELIRLLAEHPDIRFETASVLEFFSSYERFKRDILYTKGALRVPAKYPRYRKGENPSLETMLRISEFFDIPLILILQEPGIATKLLGAMSPTILMMAKNNLERDENYGDSSIREMERATFGTKLWEYHEEIQKGDQLSFGAFLRSYGVSKGFANYHFPGLCRDIASHKRRAAVKQRWSSVGAIYRAFFDEGLLKAYRTGAITSQDLLVSTVVRLTGASTSLVRKVFREICRGRTQLDQIRHGVFMTDKDLSGALRTVLNILDAWNVSREDRLALLGCSQECYRRWADTRQLGDPLPDTLERLSYILGIWRALKTLFPESAVADTWIHRPNYDSLFGGQPPLNLMVTGRIEDLSRVRQFLDGWSD